ncbi:hypothetical protein SUGI_0500950 [Cryptomeria japonica]|nr:hypothetical protein SUGI_0500950 [Cryptomeria japonica]
MALMEKNTRKRQRFESREYSRNPSIHVESEANPGKRVCDDSNCGNVDVFTEIMSQMDTHEVDFPQESILEELVWDMIKQLEGEIVSSSSDEESSVNKCGSNQICETLGDNGDEAQSVSRDDSTKLECEYITCYGNLEDLLWVSDSEPRIPCSPQMDFCEAVNEYFQDYGFFECLEMERDAEHQLLLQKWWGDNDSEGYEITDLISVQDSSLFSNN